MLLYIHILIQYCEKGTICEVLDVQYCSSNYGRVIICKFVELLIADFYINQIMKIENTDLHKTNCIVEAQTFQAYFVLKSVFSIRSFITIEY